MKSASRLEFVGHNPRTGLVAKTPTSIQTKVAIKAMEVPVKQKRPSPLTHWATLLTLALTANLAVSSSGAQSNVTRDQVLLAAQTTPNVQAAQARQSAAQAQVLAANTPVSGSANAGHAWTGTDPKPSVGSAIKSDWTYGAQINFAGLFGEANTSRVQTTLGLERAKRALLGARVRSSKNALQLWHGLRRAVAAFETSKTALELAEMQDKAAETRKQSGAINQSERENSSIGLQSAQLEHSRSKVRLDAAQTQLETVLGIKGLPSGDWWALPDAGLSGPNPNDAAMLEQREDVFEARATLQNAELDLARAQHAVLPTLNLDAGLQGSSGNLGLKLNSDMAAGLSYTNPNSSLPNGTTSWNLGLSLNVPIDPAKLGVFPALQQSIEATRASLQATLQAALAELASKRSAVVLLRSGLDLSEQQLAFSKQNLERSKQRFLSGLVPALEVKKAELDLHKSGDGLLMAQADLDMGLLEVYEALNQPVLGQ